MRIRWLDGEYEGLEEWVPKVRLVVPWDQATALLEDESRVLAAIEASDDAYGSIEWKAVQEVFFSLPGSGPEDEVFFGHRAAERELLVIENLDAAARRLDLNTEELLGEPHAFVDRFGTYKAPFGAAVRVAKHCCQHYVQDVLRYLKGEEDELRETIVSGLLDPADRYRIDSKLARASAEARISEQRPVFALIRQWCGKQAVNEFNEVLALRDEVDRLTELVRSTAEWLRRSGHSVKAAMLTKELDQRGVRDD